MTPHRTTSGSTTSDPTTLDAAGAGPEAVVLVPTFRRPAMLAATLASLASQRGGRRFAVLVADNAAAAVRPAMARHPVVNPPHRRSGPVPRIYGSGDLLIRQASLARLAAPKFDLGFDHLGGGDADFFLCGLRVGLRFHRDDDAVIEEVVSPARTTPSRVLRRGLRIDAVDFLVERRDAGDGAGRAVPCRETAAAVPLNHARGIVSLMLTGIPLLASQRPAMAMGRLLATWRSLPKPYGGRTSR